LREQETAPMTAISNVTVASIFSIHLTFAANGVTDHPISLFGPKRLVTT
jgi:hypothetical protein